MSKSYKETMNNIKAFVFDVDGVLTDGTLHITNDGQLLRQMNAKDGYAMKTAIDLGFSLAIISGGNNEGTKIRLQNLGIKDVFMGVHDKLEKLYEFTDGNQLKPDDVLYMGDDIPDYLVMQKVGLPTCPQDAAPEIKAISKYISHVNGGKGAVRDVIEQVLKVQGKWMQDFDASEV